MRFQERAKIAQERAKIAQERANIAQERTKIAQDRANIAQARATIASRSRQDQFFAIFGNICRFWALLARSRSAPEPILARFSCHVFVCSRVLLLLRLVVCSFVRSFVQSFARAFVRLSSSRPFDFELRVLVRSHTRSFAIRSCMFARLRVCSSVPSFAS